MPYDVTFHYIITECVLLIIVLFGDFYETTFHLSFIFKVKNYMKKYLRLNSISKSKPIIASFWFIVATFFNRAISMITTPIYTRLLDQTDYAIVALYNTWSGIFSVVFTLSIAANAFHVGLIRYQDDKDSFISSMIGLTGALVTIGFVIFKIGEVFFINLTGLTTELFYLMFAGLFLNVVLGFWTLYKKYNYEYKSAIFVNLLVTLMSQIITYFIVSKTQVNQAFLKIFFNAIPSYILSIFLCISLVRKGKIIISKKYWKFAVLFCFPLIPHYMSNHFLNQIDRIIIVKYIGQNPLAIYSVAYTMSSVISMLWGAISGVFTPWMYKNIKTDKVSIVKDVILSSLIILSLLSILIILLGPEIMSILGPKSYEFGVNVIPPIVTGTFIFMIVTLHSSIKLYFDNNKIVTIITLFSAFLNFILNLLFIPKYGIVGAAYTTLVSYLLMYFMHIITSCKLNINKYFDNKIYYIIIIMTTLSISMNYIYGSLIIRLLLILLFFIIIIIYSIKVITKYKK